METVEGMLPDVAYKNALLAGDIEYGYWDPATLTFTNDPNFEDLQAGLEFLHASVSAPLGWE